MKSLETRKMFKIATNKTTTKNLHTSHHRTAAATCIPLTKIFNFNEMMIAGSHISARQVIRGTVESLLLLVCDCSNHAHYRHVVVHLDVSDFNNDNLKLFGARHGGRRRLQSVACIGAAGAAAADVVFTFFSCKPPPKLVIHQRFIANAVFMERCKLWQLKWLLLCRLLKWENDWFFFCCWYCEECVELFGVWLSVTVGEQYLQSLLLHSIFGWLLDYGSFLLPEVIWYPALSQLLVRLLNWFLSPVVFRI